MNPESTSLLREVNQFLQRGTMSESRLGRGALRDPNFVYDLRNGRAVRGGTAAKVRAYISSLEQSGGD